MKKTIFLFILLLNGLFSYVQAQQRLNTPELLFKTLKQVPGCTEYCINALVLKMYITITGPKFYWTVNVSHNSPDFLTMTHLNLDETALTEFNVVFGKIYKEVTELVFKKPIEIVNKSSIVEIGGGRYQYDQFGKHQSVQFSEATILGHPASLVFAMFGGGGLKPNYKKIKVGSGKEEREIIVPCRTHGCLEDKNNELGGLIRRDQKKKPNQKINIKSYLLNWPKSAGSFSLVRVLALHDFIAKSQSIINSINKMTQVINNGLGGFGVRFDRTFCPVDLMPYVPYYLSGIDSYSWRMGYPITDPQHSKTILNPISKDVIGKGRENWGHVYPREGTVNADSTAKLGAVVAHRANSILSDPTSKRIFKRPGQNHIGVWSKEIPSNNLSCRKSITSLGEKEHSDGSYAFTSWPRKTCDLAKRGKTILRIPLKVCLTDKVKD